MKNNSDEINIAENKPNIFPKISQNQPNTDYSKKSNITSEPSELKGTLNKSTYHRYTSKTARIKIISIIIYYLVIIALEFIYRDYLFKKSITIQEQIHLSTKNFLILKISKMISFFGGELAALFFAVLIFLFMPLNYSFLIIQCIIYSAYFTNTLKMIYQSERPNWISKYLSYSCESSYGNPSGHAFTSINLYLCLAHIFSKYFKIRYTLRIFILIFFIFISILIIISRVILAAHSINQIIYGTCLGIGVYFILIHIIGYHNYSSVEFYQHIKKKKVKKIYYIFHIFLLIITIFIYLFTKNKDTSWLDKSIFNGVRCPVKSGYKKFKNDGLFQALSITAILGVQFGIDFLFVLLKANNYVIGFSIIEWNKNPKIKFIFLRFFVILFSAIGIILYFTIPGNINLFFIFVFKSALAFFLGMAGIYGLGIFSCIKLKIANKDIYKMDALHEITAEA